MCPPATPAPWNPSSPPPCAPRRMPATTEPSEGRQASAAAGRRRMRARQQNALEPSSCSASNSDLSCNMHKRILPLLSLPASSLSQPDREEKNKNSKTKRPFVQHGAATAGNKNICCRERDARLRWWRPSAPAIMLYSLGGSSLHPMATPSRPSLPYSCAPPAVAAGGRGNHYGGRLPMRCHHRLKHGERCASCLHDADLRSAACPLADVG